MKLLTIELRIQLNNALVDFIDFNLTNKKLEAIVHKPIKGTGLGKLKDIYKTEPEVAILALIFYQESRRGYTNYETMSNDIILMNPNLSVNECIKISKSLLRLHQI